MPKSIPLLVLGQTLSKTIQQEIDEIFMLLCYSLVFQDWQAEEVAREDRRGYNIGALLVSPENLPVYHGLNCINSTDNATQHSEVRTIMGYLAENGGFNLAGFSIYATLEPCVMCAGMITMTAIERAIYGQKDIAYSKAFERLSIHTEELPPYPRQVQAQAAKLLYRYQLDRAYADYLLANEEKILAKFLSSQAAEKIFASAATAFQTYRVDHEANRPVLEAAQQYLQVAVRT